MFGGRPRPNDREMPCTPWTLPDPRDCCDCPTTDADAEMIELAIMWAIADVYVSTCRRFTGCCRVEVRPCIACDVCGSIDSCGCDPCGPYVTADLWAGFRTDRINRIEAIYVDGALWGPDGWRLDPDRDTGRGRYLVLQDLDAYPRLWPTQRPTLPNRQVGTWSIVADIGWDPPPDVLKAASDLACEYLKQCKDPEKCSLPSSVTSIVRRGTTVNFGDRGSSSGVPSLDRVVDKWACSIEDFERAVDVCDDTLWIPVARPDPACTVVA